MGHSPHFTLVFLSFVYFFSNFSCMFLIPIFFSNLNYNCSNLLDLRNLQEQVKKAFCYQKLFWPFTVWINCSSDLKNFENSWPSASNFKSFSQLLEQFFLTVGQNNFGNKIPFLIGPTKLSSFRCPWISMHLLSRDTYLIYWIFILLWHE